MKTPNKILMLLMAMILLIGCSSKDDSIDMVMVDDDVSQTDDDDTSDADGSSGDVGLEEVEIAIELPEGSDLDLSTAQIEALTESYTIETDGTSNINVLKDEPTLVYLKNNAGAIILMGFVSKDHPTLNVASTFEASVYFGMGTVFRLSAVKDKFFTEFRDYPDLAPYIGELEQLYATNDLVLTTMQYTTWLNETLLALFDNKQVIDFTNQILVSDTSIKSGVQIIQNENDIFSVDILNYIRRRGHAFFYKVAVKSDAEADFVTIPGMENIGSGNQMANFEVPIAPVVGVTSFQGNLLEWLLGNGSKLALTKSDPRQLPLLDDEFAVRYKVRILGPGQEKNFLKTDAEIDKATFLAWETLFLDIVIPLVTTAVGLKDIGDVGSAIEITTAIEIGNALLASSPNAIDALLNGDVRTAGTEFIKALIANFAGTEKFFELMITVLRKVKPNAFSSLTTAELAEKMVAPLTIANAILTSSDIARVLNETLSSNKLEEFPVTVSRSKVVIVPSARGISVGETVALKARVLDDEVIEDGEYDYRWETSGTYGVFTADSSTDEITYQSNADTNIPQNAEESFFVDIYRGAEFIGKDSVNINIHPTEYVIRPDGLTLKGNSILNLGLVDLDGNPLVDETLLDDLAYKVVWTIGGAHGQLEQAGNPLYFQSSGSITKINSSTVSYYCTDTETERGQEQITAKIFLATDEEQTDFSLVEETSATINIENDDSELIYYVQHEVGTSPPSFDGVFYNYGVWSLWRWDPNEAEGDIPEGYEVERYQMQVMERIPDPIPSCTINGGTWFPENQAMDLIDGTYQVDCFYSGGSTPFQEDVSDGYNSLLSLYQSVRGYAKVTVHLKPKNQ